VHPDERGIGFVERMFSTYLSGDSANAVAYHLRGGVLDRRFRDQLHSTTRENSGADIELRSAGYPVGDSFFQVFTSPEDVNLADLLRIRLEGPRPVILVPEKRRAELALLSQPYDAAGGISLDYSLDGFVGATLDWIAQYDPGSLDTLLLQSLTDLNSRLEAANLHIAFQLPDTVLTAN
jgi:hypothetical protein